MNTTTPPSGLPDHGYSMQAAALASALIEREYAHVYRSELRDWLDRIESPTGDIGDDMEAGRDFAEFLTNLIRIGAGLQGVED